MKINNIGIVTSFFLAHSITAQAISVSFSLINGKPWRGVEYPAIFPSAYGVLNSSNSPGGRSRHKSIVYKNLIYSFHGRPLTTNDVWAFNFTSKTWAWLAGSSISPLPSYGNRGIPSVLNTPGFRESFVGDINRARNEYFLFGGQTSNGIRSDIWTFDLESNMWTWLFGLTTLNESPIYNSIGVWTSSSTPGGRYAACGLIYPSTDEFLLYGGFNGGLTYRSDIWVFNLANSRWTWISGSSVRNVGTLAGAKGEWSTGFFPAARFLAADLVFSSALNILYLFGGKSNFGMFNDFWAFNRDTLEWAWLSGSTTVNSAGICGTMGYPGRNNTPGARIDSSLVYHDQSGLLILTGGAGYTCGGAYGNSPDTWAFDTNLNEWGWISGSSVFAYPPPVNYFTFAAVRAGAIAVDSDTSAIYIFGGVGPLSQPLEGNVDYIWRVNMTAAPRFVSPALKASPSATDQIAEQELMRTVKVSMTTRISETNYLSKLGPSKDHKSIFTVSSSIRYQLLAAIGLALLVVMSCISYKIFTGFRTKKSTLQTDSASASASSYELDTTTTYNSNALTTIGPTSFGVYIPGGLKVDGSLSYRVEKELARGGGGRVCLATSFNPELKIYGELVIVKTPNAKLMDERAIALFHQEIALMNAFKECQNIATLLGFSENPYSTIMKYYANGSLSHWIHSGHRTLGQSHAFLKDISSGISTLHSNGVAHCDLKPDNVLIDSGWRLFAVITDFGISRIVSNKLLKVGAYEVQIVKGASLAYAAPEVLLELNRQGVTRKSPVETISRDVYAIGLIITVLLNGDDAWRWQGSSQLSIA